MGNIQKFACALSREEILKNTPTIHDFEEIKGVERDYGLEKSTSEIKFCNLQNNSYMYIFDLTFFIDLTNQALDQKLKRIITQTQGQISSFLIGL